MIQPVVVLRSTSFHIAYMGKLALAITAASSIIKRLANLQSSLEHRNGLEASALGSGGG